VVRESWVVDGAGGGVFNWLLCKNQSKGNNSGELKAGKK